MRIIIGGILGRMGREVTAAAQNAGITVSCGVDVAYAGKSTDIPVVTGYDQITEAADVLIDFSKPEGIVPLLAFCEKAKLPCVLCATGFLERDVRHIEAAASVIPILRSANMSLGIHVMEQLVAMATQALGTGFDIEIVEKHHRMKVDSPSGTAIMLYNAVQNASQEGVTPVYGRCDAQSGREVGDIGMHSVRGGTVTGEHEVGFYGEGEQIILTHRAESRALFAQGALRAAAFLQGKAPGLYTMRDVVTEMLDKK